MSKEIERCQLCDHTTERCGEDSIFIEASDGVLVGPLCMKCLNGITKWVVEDFGVSPAKDRRLTELAQALAAKDEQIARLDEKLADADDALGLRDNQIAQQAQRIADQQRAITIHADAKDALANEQVVLLQQITGLKTLLRQVTEANLHEDHCNAAVVGGVPCNCLHGKIYAMLNSICFEITAAPANPEGGPHA